MKDRKAILVIGAGDSTGGAIARRFASEGFVACVTRRTADKLEPLVTRIQAEGGEAHGFASDARKEVDVETLVTHIEREIAPIEVAVYNVGANVRFGILETSERVYRKVWEMGALGGFLMGREVAKAMLAARPRHHPLHRRHRQPARLGRLLGLRGRQACAARAGAEHGARARPEGHPRGPCRHRRRDRHRLHRRELSRALREKGRATAS